MYSIVVCTGADYLIEGRVIKLSYADRMLVFFFIEKLTFDLHSRKFKINIRDIITNSVRTTQNKLQVYLFLIYLYF